MAFPIYFYTTGVNSFADNQYHLWYRFTAILLSVLWCTRLRFAGFKSNISLPGFRVGDFAEPDRSHYNDASQISPIFGPAQIGSYSLPTSCGTVEYETTPVYVNIRSTNVRAWKMGSATKPLMGEYRMTSLLEYIAAFPVPLPSVFVQVMHYLAETAQQHDVQWQQLCDMVFGFTPAPARPTYPQIPPEMVTFGRSGVDGTHYGFVIHAPEIAAHDYPVGELCPMDDDGVIRLGSNTHEALETLSTFELQRKSKTKPKLSVLNAMRSKFGFTFTSAESRYDASGNGLRISPLVPYGWRYQPAADGVGVLAESEMFDPVADYETVTVTLDSVEQWLGRADRAMASASYATALFYLRQMYWFHWVDPQIRIAVTERLIRAYRQLNRPLLARAARLRSTP